MSDDEEENFCYFGKPLDPYDEDAFPKKRPITVEEQIATDAQGRRRFHGAFTGGFSAGFFNTVGSLEGWTPSEFKSTRQEKARNVVQKPEDFMDQEDLGEYGIAPQTVRATKDYSTSKKRRKQVFSEGPIPGVPVLETLLTSGNETIGNLLLRKLSIKDKMKKMDEDLDSDKKSYGCHIPEQYKIPEKIENKQYKIPQIYTENLKDPKANTFGLAYRGLDRTHVNLFSHSNLIVTDKNNKKFSIAGQAFGVGAFENDDDDIYSKDDMGNYDFELTKEKSTKKSTSTEGTLLFGMFKPSRAPLVFKKLYPPPVIPHSFTGKHKVKKSRFEQVEIKTEPEETSRNQINPNIRARYLGEETPETYTPSRQKAKEKPAAEKEKPKPKSIDISMLLTDDRFVAASQTEDVTNILEPVRKVETLHGTSDMREASRMKMFGPLTRITSDWRPCGLLCKRFNVPEPLIDLPEQNNRKRTKNLIFENQKFSDEDLASLKAGCSVPSTSSSEETSRSVKVNEEPSEIPNNEDVAVKSEEMSPETKKDEETDNKVEDRIENENTIKDITEKIGIGAKEKVDLFKAVFLSSSESESEGDDETSKNEQETKTEEFKETIMSDLVPKIRPLRQGILSNITFQPRNTDIKTDESNKTGNNTEGDEEREDAPTNTIISESESNEMTYGPQLPSQKVIGAASVVKINLTESDDEWIEKGSKSKHKKSKHKKDKKREKKKHKHSKRDKDE